VIEVHISSHCYRKFGPLAMKCQFTNKESRVLKKRYEVFCYLLDEEDKDRDSVILLLRERMASF
jgi:hypothetical protein